MASNTMNRLSSFIVPTTTVLALVACGYILWDQTSRRTTTSRPKAVIAAESQSYAIAGKTRAEEPCTNERRQGEQEDVQAGGDTSLLREHDWNVYTKMSDRIRRAMEAMLLGDILSSLGATLNEGEVSDFLSASTELRNNLLECWEAGCFDLLRHHDTVVALVEDVSHRRDINAGTSTAAVNTADEALQLNIVPAIINSKRDDAAVTRDGSHGELNSAPISLQMSRQDEERKRDGEGDAIRRAESDDHTIETECLEDANAAIIREAPAEQVRLDGQTLGGKANTTFSSQGVEIYNSVFNDVKGDQNFYSSDHHRKVAEWYSPTDYRVTHHDISKKRANNTGVWLLESEHFKQWQTDPDCRILWCPGIPGVGKTTIASLVIDYLRQRRSETVAVGFAYFNYKLQSHQSTTMVLECLSRQLYEVYQGEEASISLEAFYDANQKDHSRPPTTGLHTILSTACRQFRRYYVVLDALDEYLEKYDIENLCKLLSSLASLSPAIKLLVTSRVLDGMKELFEDLNAVRQDIDADDADMSTYIWNRIGNARFQFDIPDELLQEIVQKVKEAAGGRFLMAELHMNTLAAQLNRGNLKKALASLSHDIDITYERVLQRFKTYPDLHRELAMMTLTWITRAKRRLSVKEIQHALATEPGLENIEDYVTPMSTITSLCAGLVIVRDGSLIFVHFTAQDFFKNPRIQSEYFSDAEDSILKTCLAYISLPLCTETYQNGHRWSSISDIIPFYDYAARNLGIHAQGQSDGASKDLDIFLSSNTTAFNQCCHHMQTSYSVRNFPPDSTISAIFVAIYYDRAVPLQDLLSPLNDVPLMLEAETPLMYAARIGRTACLRAMLDWSQTQPDVATLDLLADNQKIQSPLLVGDINRRDGNGFTALLHACAQGQEEAVGILLNHEGINVNVADRDGGTPLSHAADRGHEGVVVLLLKHKSININLAGKEGTTPFSHAAKKGHEGVVRLLLNHHGIDVNLAESDGWTPLIWAAHDGQEGVVKLLLNHEDIDVNLAESNGWTPLIHAARYGHEAVVELLLSHEGIDVNLADKKGGTPLNRAAEDGHEGVVGLLLNHEGIDVNLAGKNGRTPLNNAAERGHEGVVGLLLEHEGIDVNLADKKGGTPLSRAAEDGHEQVVRLLLNHKSIDVNLADYRGWTPLFFAANSCREEVTNHLLHHPEIQLNRQDTEGATALTRTMIDWDGGNNWWGAIDRAKPVIKLLISRDDLDINLPDNEGHTPLFYAQRRANEDRRWEAVCELLRARGAVAVLD